GDDLGTGDKDAGVVFLLDGDVDVFHLLDGFGWIELWVHQRVVDVEHGLLPAYVPGARVSGELAVEVGVGAQRVEKSSLVVGAAPHPAIADAGPGGDGIALSDQVLARARG